MALNNTSVQKKKRASPSDNLLGNVISHAQHRHACSLYYSINLFAAPMTSYDMHGEVFPIRQKDDKVRPARILSVPTCSGEAKKMHIQHTRELISARYT